MAKINPNVGGGLARIIGNLWFDITFQEDRCVWKSQGEINGYFIGVAVLCGILSLTFIPYTLPLALVSVRKILLLIAEN